MRSGPKGRCLEYLSRRRLRADGGPGLKQSLFTARLG